MLMFYSVRVFEIHDNTTRRREEIFLDMELQAQSQGQFGPSQALSPSFLDFSSVEQGDKSP
jgi:hypothetical protein